MPTESVDASRSFGIPGPVLEPLYREHLARLVDETAAALEATGWDALLVHAGVPRSRTRFDDQDWPLRPTPAFQHWCPLAVPDCAILFTPGRAPVLFHNTAHSYWEGAPVPESDHFWSAFETVDLDGPDRVKDLLPQGRRTAFVGDDEARAARWGLPAEAANPPALLERLDLTRARKSAYEIACISEANRRAAAGYRRVFEAFAASPRGASELELHLAYLAATAQDDAETPYKNIVAMGANASILHHVRYGRRPPTGPAVSLLVDAGATYLGYQSDITRTAVAGGDDDPAARTFAELVRRIEGLQQEICGRVRVGVPFEDLHDGTHALLAPILRDLGIARASDDELVGGGITRRFLPHGLGHSLGLVTHDVGCRPAPPRPENRFLRQTRVVAEGLVTTIEPGCYFIEALLDELRRGDVAYRIDWALVESLRAFGGVRIEDDLAVGADGARNLTREHLPR